ncbi:DNA-binding protein [Bradyrhizobium sp. SZCCHNS2015]|uniref:DNA-binding protein n=1 Tax=Bradyrhizobium sp. SZCCHNS2015 TaxID=3057305 RepID=UPI0028E7B632|nr:DNA-binding protein [Bradyrhizobium sp. SZCCHNS2015]
MESAVQSFYGRRSFRVEEIAQRNAISRTQVFMEIRGGRLNARKIGARTIITDEDEAAWLASLPQTKNSVVTAA